MTTPPLAVLQRADALAQAAHEGLQPGAIKIGGTTYAGSVIIHAARQELTDKGFVLLVRLEAWIAKANLATCPSFGTTVLCNTKAYKVIETEGENATDTEWHLIATRQPGQDS